MDFHLVHVAIGWLAQLDPACIVCNSNPDAVGWAPWAAAGVGAGASLGLSDLFGPEVGGTAIGDTSVRPSTADDDRERSADTDPPGGNEPLDPHNTLPPVNQFSPGEDIERRVAAEERERRRLRDLYRMTHPDATTAGPPPPESTGDTVVDTFFTIVREIDWE